MNLKMSPVAASVIFAAAAAIAGSHGNATAAASDSTYDRPECGDLPVPGRLLGVSRPIERPKPAGPFCPAVYACSRAGRCRFRHRFRGPGSGLPVLGPQRNLLLRDRCRGVCAPRRSPARPASPWSGCCSRRALTAWRSAYGCSVSSRRCTSCWSTLSVVACLNQRSRKRLKKHTTGQTFFSGSKNWKRPSKS